MKRGKLVNKLVFVFLSIFAFFAMPTLVEAFNAEIKEESKYEVLTKNNEGSFDVDYTKGIVCYDDNDVRYEDCAEIATISYNELDLNQAGAEQVVFVVTPNNDETQSIELIKTYYKVFSPQVNHENMGSASQNGMNTGIVVNVNNIGGINSDTTARLDDDGFGGFNDFILWSNNQLTVDITGTGFIWAVAITEFQFDKNGIDYSNIEIQAGFIQ